MTEKESELEAEIPVMAKFRNGTRRGLSSLYNRNPTDFSQSIFLASIMIIGMVGGGLILGDN